MNYNPFDDSFDDPPLFLKGQVVPTAVHVLGLSHDFFAGQMLDGEEISFTLKPRGFLAANLGQSDGTGRRTPKRCSALTHCANRIDPRCTPGRHERRDTRRDT